MIREQIKIDTVSKDNAFDLLRLLLAMAVLVTHGILLGGYNLQDPLEKLSKGQTNFAELGVMGFFVLSGFLISASFKRNKSVFTFISNRLLRILPGFWLCLLLTVFLFAPIIYLTNTRSISDYFINSGNSAIEYICHNFLLKINKWSIKDVLNNAVYKESLNGSLWSLLPELQCYFFTLIVGYFGLLKKNNILYLIFCIAIFFYFAINFNFSKSFGPTILILSPAIKLYASYIAGSLVYVFSDKLFFNKRETFFVACFTLILIKFGGFHLISPLLIALTLLNTFRHFTFNLKYDISYGVYIYGFLIEQLLYKVFNTSLPFSIFLILSFGLSTIFGLGSFVIVESPFLKLKQKINTLIVRFRPINY